MKPSKLQFAVCLLAALVACPGTLPATAAEPANRAVEIAAACRSATQKVREESFVTIGGIEQWVTIKGDNCANPVILFLHGGPGNPISPFADSIYAAWEQEFTLVQWDQRAAGKTYARNPPGADSVLTIERMRDDGIELVAYLRERLGKQKVILTGGSWGSILGMHMAKARPDLFHAYVGVSQLVSERDNQAATYAQTLSLARAAADADSIAKLLAIGAPPWVNPRNSGILRRLTRIYEAKSATPAPKSWWVPAPPYATPQLLQAYEDSDDYSYLQFVGRKGDGMFSKIDLRALGKDFAIPVFFIHGADDLVADPGVARRYFDELVAPQKEFVLVTKTGHDPNPALIEAQYQVMRQGIGSRLK